MSGRLLDLKHTCIATTSPPPGIDKLRPEDYDPPEDNSPPQSVVPKMQEDMDNTLGTRIPMVDVRTLIITTPQPPDPIFTDLFDRGDKIALIGGSKTRKTFFLLQMALSLASGRKFLQWDVPEPLRVLFLQMEVKAAHFHKRVWRMAQALHMQAEEVQNFHLLNGRGYRFDGADLAKRIEDVQADLVILDPLYKLHDGDENLARDVKPILANFDNLAKETGAAVLYCHHDPKGTPGDRSNRDRGAGSNVLGRDYDCGIFLTEHRNEEGAVVVDALLRNYPPVDRFTIRFSDDHFAVDDELAPVVATAKSDANGKQRGPSNRELSERAFKLLKKPVNAGDFKNIIQDELSVGERKAQAIYNSIAARDDVEVIKARTFPRQIFIGPLGTVLEVVVVAEKKYQAGKQRKLKI